MYLYENRSWDPQTIGVHPSLLNARAIPDQHMHICTCIVWHVSDKMLHNKIYIIQNNLDVWITQELD